MDDWDSVSSETPKDSVNNAWDAVSALQPSSRRRRVVPDNLMLDNVTASQQEAPVALPDAQQYPSFLPHAAMPEQEDVTVMVAASASTDMLALPPAFTPSRYKRIGRDILAFLGTALFVALEIYFISILSLILFPVPFPLQIFVNRVLNLLLIPYITGIFVTIFATAISGRKGFDALFPVLIGYIVSIVVYAVLSVGWQAVTYYGVYLFFLGSLLGAATYIVTRKVRSRSTRRRVNK